MAERGGEGRTEQREEERESIWSIPATYKRWYFGLFSFQVIFATAWVIREAIGDQTLGSIPSKVAFVWQGLAPMAITSAAFSLVIIETWATSMVIASWLAETLEKRRRKEIERVRLEGKLAAESARLEATAEVQNRWEEWNRRRETAIAAGEDFNEPPPGVDQETEGPQQK